MADAHTSNRNLVKPEVGGDTGTWGTVLNTSMIDLLDAILGGTQATAITVADVTLTLTQWDNCAIKLSGVLTGARSLILPLNANSLTVAVGGLFVVDNQTSGAYAVTVKTAAAGSTGVTVAQGLRTFLYSDGANVYYADDSSLKPLTYAGNPNGNVAGTAATAITPPSVCWDYTNFILYVCTASGNAAGAVWTNTTTYSATIGVPQGYLTPVSDTPVITADSIAATVLYYTPYFGATAAIHNGKAIVPYQFTQMQLTLTTAQSANNIYDIFLAYNAGVPVIGTGPSWAAGAGGSVTAGSCARGTGAGGTAISRASPSGLWVNTAQVSLTSNTGGGNSTITVAAGQGIYLGSINIGAAAGQITCHRSYGQSRRWDVYNAYNRQPINLLVGDATASWTYSTATWRPSNNSASNSCTVFSGLAEPSYTIKFNQRIITNTGSGGGSYGSVAVGWNSTTGISGLAIDMGTSAVAGPSLDAPMISSLIKPPSLGINVVTCLENGLGGGNAATFYGTEQYMELTASWAG